MLLASELILHALDRPRDKTEKMAPENRCAVRMGPRLIGHRPPTDSLYTGKIATCEIHMKQISREIHVKFT